jgi:hypothetical protein
MDFPKTPRAKESIKAQCHPESSTANQSAPSKIFARDEGSAFKANKIMQTDVFSQARTPAIHNQFFTLLNPPA